MNTFLKTYRLLLTPLSPIHIGCGEDFEPTNYVIDDGVLYGFDPSRAVLTEAQRSELTNAAASNSLLTIHRFFKKHAQTFQAHANVLIPVASGVVRDYVKKIDTVANREGDGREVFNKLALERTSYTGSDRQPYIPGSSFKGAIRTPLLDALNRSAPPSENCSKTSSQLESRLLKGDFATSPLRLLKVGDLMPTFHPARRVMYSVNLKKKKVTGRDGKEITGKGPSARKECILHGQYRSFAAVAVLPSLDPHTDIKTTPVSDLRPVDFKIIAKQSNTYHLARLRRELSVLDERGFINPDWKLSVERLLKGSLNDKLESGDAILVRLGRYGGAESKTLSDVARIKIMGARVDGKQQFTTESVTKTVWMAAEREDDQKHLLPFGWAVVEIDPQGDLPELKAWCAEQSKGRPDMAAIRHAFEVEKQAASDRKRALAQEAAARDAAKLAEQAIQAERERALASMSPQGQQIETLRQACENWAKQMPPHGNYKKQTADVGKAGFFQDANRLVTLALGDASWSAQDKLALAEMLEIWLPQVVGPWEKDQRKKLKLAALKGQ